MLWPPVELLRAAPVVCAYVAGLFAAPVDLSGTSLVLQYAEVCNQYDLRRLQALGDWVLWVEAVLPEANANHHAVVQAVGQASYYRCYRLVPEWRVYEELADTLPTLVAQLRVPSTTR